MKNSIIFSPKLINWKHLLIFILILVVAIALRLYRIGGIPPGVNRDEAAIGYNAYSILTTGKDEYGRFLPLSFESFGDWKLPAYIYLSIPFIKIFGLSTFSVRLLSLIASIITIALVPFISYSLFKNFKIAFISMLLITITPWHIHFSRIAYEANLAVCFATIGLFILLKMVQEIWKPWLLIISSLFFALTLYTYHGNHVFTLLILISICIIFYQKLIKNKFFGISLIVFTVLSGIIFYATVFGADKTKISGIGILGTPGIIHEKIEIPRNEHTNPNSLIVKFTHNQYQFVLESIFSNYISSFSPNFLFFNGGTNHSHNIEGIGNLYYIDSLFIFIGLIMLIKNYRNKNNLLLLCWFFIAPIAGSFTKDAPHSARMFAIFPCISIISAYGFYTLGSLASLPSTLKKIFIVLIIGILINSALKYLDLYFIHFPHNEGIYWSNGYKQIIEFIQLPENSNKQVIFNHPEYSPYIFILFYSKINPALYQQYADRYDPTDDAFVHVRKFDRYSFVYNYEKITQNQDNILYINLNMQAQTNSGSDKSKIQIKTPNNQLFATISKTY